MVFWGGICSTWGIICIEMLQWSKAMGLGSNLSFIAYKLCVLGTFFAFSKLQLSDL